MHRRGRADVLKAISSSSWTFCAGISPAAMRQKMQFGSWHHGGSPVDRASMRERDDEVQRGRLANSARPDRPSRRSSSAITRAGVRPNCASATMLWNHGRRPVDDLGRVAVLAAMTTSVASLSDLLQDGVGALWNGRDIASCRGRRRARRSPGQAGQAVGGGGGGGGWGGISHRGGAQALMNGRWWRDPSGPDRPPARPLDRRPWCAVPRRSGMAAGWQAMPGSWPSCVMRSSTTSGRSRCGSNAPSAHGRIPRPCARGGCAIGSSRPPSPSSAVRASLAVHPREHQHVAAVLLRDHRHEAVGSPGDSFQPVHGGGV